jgi:ribosomal protein L29
MPIARFEMPDGRIARFEVAEGTTPAQAQALIAEKMATTASPMSFGETGGGAATGRPINRGQLNVQATPRPLESAMAGFTKSMMDVPVGAAQLATGGNLGTSQLAQRLGQQANEYQEANPIAYGTGRVAGAVAPAMGAANVIGQIPSFAKAAPLAQNIGMGTALGAMTPEETGKTGQELYKEQAKQGLIGGSLGAALTPLQKLAGVLRGPEQTSQMAGAVEKAREAGFVIPPTQAKGSLVNRALEGTAGKISTAQNASAKNQEVFNKMAAKSLGLPEEEILTPESLKNIRTVAGKAYENIENIGTIKPSKEYTEGLNQLASKPLKAQAGFPNAKPSPIIDLAESLKSEAFDGSAAVAKIIDLRDAANTAYASNQKLLGNANKKAAELLENEIERHLKTTGQKEMLNEFRDARQLIAKTYTVEKAMNPVSGNISGKALAAELKKGKPLSAELKAAAEFATQFPKAAQTVESMGSLPQTSPLDIGAAGVMASLTNPAALASLGVRPGARAAALSGPVQNRLVQGKITPEQANLAKLLMLQGGIPATNALIKGVGNE